LAGANFYMNKLTNESEVIRSASAGDREAFKNLVNNYQTGVYRVCLGFVHTTADAEDLTQEVFIEVFRSLVKFRGDSEFSTWLYRIAVNKSLNYLRVKSRNNIISLFDFRTPANPVLNHDPAAGDDSSPDNVLIKADREKAIKDALNRLPGTQKTAFVLSRYDDLPNAEIAEIMQLSISSVESLLFRAKRNLRKILLPYYKKNIE
jgi:RNA polymerase sigma-70 factor (ECF subfamily)